MRDTDGNIGVRRCRPTIARACGGASGLKNGRAAASAPTYDGTSGRQAKRTDADRHLIPGKPAGRQAGFETAR